MIKPFALVGLSGAGKSTIGRCLAEKLGLKFWDSDSVIEARSKQSIKMYFAQNGETAFRELERQVLLQLFDNGSLGVIATGGGCVLIPENRALLQLRSHVIYLKTSVDQLYLRLKNDQSRPLLAGDMRKRLFELEQQRAVFYQEIAHLTINSGDNSVSKTIQTIVEHFQLEQ